MRIALAGVCICALGGAALAAPGDSVAIGRGSEVRVAPRPDAPVLKQVDQDRPAIERDRRRGWVEVEIPNLLVRGWLPEAGLVSARDAGRSSAAPRPRLKTRGLGELDPPPIPVAALRDQPGAPRMPPAKPEAGDGGGGEGGRLARLLEPPPPGVTAEVAVGPATRAVAEPVAVERFRASVRYLEARPGTPSGMFEHVRWLRAGVVRITAAGSWNALARDEREAWLATLFERWLAASGAPGSLRLEIHDQDGDIMTRTGP